MIFLQKLVIFYNFHKNLKKKIAYTIGILVTKNDF